MINRDNNKNLKIKEKFKKQRPTSDFLQKKMNRTTTKRFKNLPTNDNYENDLEPIYQPKRYISASLIQVISNNKIYGMDFNINTEKETTTSICNKKWLIHKMFYWPTTKAQLTFLAIKILWKYLVKKWHHDPLNVLKTFLQMIIMKMI